jgi:hypothetical protein
MRMKIYSLCWFCTRHFFSMLYYGFFSVNFQSEQTLYCYSISLLSFLIHFSLLKWIESFCYVWIWMRHSLANDLCYDLIKIPGIFLHFILDFGHWMNDCMNELKLTENKEERNQQMTDQISSHVCINIRIEEMTQWKLEIVLFVRLWFVYILERQRKIDWKGKKNNKQSSEACMYFNLQASSFLCGFQFQYQSTSTSL